MEETAAVQGASVPQEPVNKEASKQESPSYDPRKQKHKVKLSGKEEEWDYDKLIEEAQKGYVSDKKWRETKEMSDLVESFKKDPWAVYEKMGKTRYDAAEELLAEKIKELSRTPEEKELHEWKSKSLDYEKKLKEIEETNKRKEREGLRSKVGEEVDKDIAEAVKELGFKPTHRIVGRIGEAMLAHLNREMRMKKQDPSYEIKKMTAKEALPRVRDDLKAEIIDYVVGVGPKEALKILPKEFLDAIRQTQVDEVVSNTELPRRKQDNPEAPKGKKQLSTDDYFKKLEQKYN